MKQASLFIAAIIIFVTSCTTNTNKTSDLENTASVSEAAVPYCYSYTLNNDTVYLELTLKGNLVTGDLFYSIYQKDKNKGSINGKMEGDVIIADYTFMSEGTTSVREVAFQKKGNDLVEGYGEMEEVNSKMIFKNSNVLQFDNGLILKNIDCKK